MLLMPLRFLIGGERSVLFHPRITPPQGKALVYMFLLALSCKAHSGI